MDRPIKCFGDGTRLVYSSGKFDDWCVFLIDSFGNRCPLQDRHYFTWLLNLGKKYGNSLVYEDFVSVYNNTNSILDQNVMLKITCLSKKYGCDSLFVDKLFTILYATMVAEENKRFTKLGKRIKRLGVSMLLNESLSVDYSVNASRNKSWREISSMCFARGF